MNFIGYAPSARIYTVADKDEAWLVQVVHGRNYVAVRCPDDQITIMPNLYTVYELDAFPAEDVIASPDLVENAKRNRITNAVFHAADAGEFMEAMAAKGHTADVVITDPPRAGCSGKFLHSLMKLAPKRIVYVSCNPETLARDLYTLTKGGYKVRKIQPVDMFPFTSHVESVVCLTHRLDNELRERMN